MSDLVALIVARFLSRRDVKAIQGDDGAYRPDRTAFTDEDIQRHIDGDISLGHYLVNQDGNCNLFALDIDLDNKGKWPDGTPFHPREVWRAGPSPEREILQRNLRGLGEGLAWRIRNRLHIPAACAYSGSKGVHVYGFTGEVRAEDARSLAIEILRTTEQDPIRGETFWKHRWAFPYLTTEVFPKQTKVREGDGLGNLMRLPLGIHTKTSKKAFFLKASASHGRFVADDPERALQYGTVGRREQPHQ